VVSNCASRRVVHCLAIGMVMATAGCQHLLAAPQEATGQPAEVAADEPSQLGSTATLEEVAPQTSAQTNPSKPASVDEEPSAPLVVHAAADPVFASRFRFWPSRESLKGGSAQTHFFRAVVMQQKMDGPSRAQVDDYLEQELHEANLVEARELLNSHSGLLAELRKMALSEDQQLDLRIRDERGIDAYMLPLEEVQAARALARLLSLQLIVRIHEGDYAGAMESWQTGFRLASLVGNGETLVQHLVGVAIAMQMLEVVPKAIKRPDCPNLYWALASLPRPLCSPRAAIETEGMVMVRILPSIEGAGDGKVTAEQWRERLLEYVGQLQQMNGMGGDGGGGFQASLYLATLATAVPELNARLAARGWNETQLAKMSPYEKMAIDASEETHYWRDRILGPFLLPGVSSQKLLAERQRELDEWVRANRVRSLGAVTVSMLLPAVSAANAAHLRLEYRLNQWMTVEALRMHAARSGGKLPVDLKSLAVVPALEDPWSANAFEYRLEQAAGRQIVTLSGKIPEPFQKQYGAVKLEFPGLDAP